MISRRKNYAYSLTGIVVAGVACMMHGPASAEDGVIIASTGGAYDRALKEAWFDPFSKATGIPVTIVSATNAEMRAKAVAMVQSGNVSWDLYLEGEIQAASDAHRRVTEDLTAFCKRFRRRRTSQATHARQEAPYSNRRRHCLSTGRTASRNQYPRPGQTCGISENSPAAGHFQTLTTLGACLLQHCWQMVSRKTNFSRLMWIGHSASLMKSGTM